MRTITTILAVLSCILAGTAMADSTIVIVRHGEKPAAGLGQLSCQGLNRALALPAVLLGRYGRPTAIYAPNPAVEKTDSGVSYAYIRPLATIEPTAIQAGLPVNVQWGFDDTSGLARRLLSQTEGTQFVAWEHHLAVKLARGILEQSGGDPAQVAAWDDNDFDSVLVIRLSGTAESRRLASFNHEQEGLDGLSGNCKQ